MTGTQLNGLSEGSFVGDEWQNSTNYPLVRVRDQSGNVTYMRTFNWSTSGVATGDKPVSTQFQLPIGFNPTGPLLLSVVANGISSAEVLFTVATNGPLDYTASGALNVTVKKVGTNYQIFDNVNIKVLASQAASITTTINVTGSSSNDVVVLDVSVLSTALPIPMSVIGGGGSDEVDFNDQANSSPTAYSLTASSLSAGPTTVSLFAIANRVLNTGSGSDTITVNNPIGASSVSTRVNLAGTGSTVTLLGTDPGSATTINADGTVPTIYYERATSETLVDGVTGPITVGNGQPRLTFNYSSGNHPVLNEISTVAARYLFYSGSTRYDTTGGARSPLAFSDDNAIAIDKTAYLPGSGPATYANLSNYDRGINGIMVDLFGGDHTAITSSDFAINVGNNNSPGSWAAGPAPVSVTVRIGAGISGSDRIELIWADNAIQQQWVEVTVKANAHTGLLADEHFFFGSEIGNTGSSDTPTMAMTTNLDVSDAVNHGATIKNNIPITNIYDFSKDGNVNNTDVSDAVNHGTTTKTGLVFINIPPI